MKHISISVLVLFACLLLSTQYAAGQVGVMTNDPISTLHVASRPTYLNIVDGIRVPQLTRAQLRVKDDAGLYTAINHQGTLVYISLIDGAANARMQKITSPGHYFFDGAIWRPFRHNSNRFIYLPPIQISITQAMVNVNQSINLYNVIQRFAQVNNTRYHTSSTTLLRLPITRLSPAHFDYVVTYYDRDVIQVLGISNNGLLNYRPLNTRTGMGSFMNVVAIIK